MANDEIIKELNSRIKPDILVCPFSKLIPFQENLVDLHDVDAAKLKKSINTAWIDPFKVWVTPSGKINILDGHQRQRILKKGGYSGKVQCVQIECKDKKEAARFVLLFRSVYGEMTSDGLYEFMNEHELILDDFQEIVDFVEIDLVDFSGNFFEGPPEEISCIDESRLVDLVENESTEFQVTFTISKEYKKYFTDYIKEKGKVEMVQKLIDMVMVPGPTPAKND